MKLFPRQRKWLLCVALNLLLVTTAVITALILIQQRGSFLVFSIPTTTALSERTLATLGETSGRISITQILPNDTPLATTTGRLLRAVATASRQVAGAVIDVQYLDPRHDPTHVAMYYNRGVRGSGILFRNESRSLFVPIQTLSPDNELPSDIDLEHILLASIARLSRSDGIQIGWLMGHGEPTLDTTDPNTGLSALRRTLELEGYKVLPVTLFNEANLCELSDDIKMLFIDRPRFALSQPEQATLCEWLDRGGRLFFLLPSSGDAGLGQMLEQWGLAIGTRLRTAKHSLNASEGFAAIFDDKHPVTRDLSHQAQLIINKTPALLPVPPTLQTKFTNLVQMEAIALPDASSQSPEPITVVAAIERGDKVSDDLAFRPGRILVASDAAFIENRYLLNHASANHDFLINAVQWLTGVPGSGNISTSQILRIGLDQRGWRRATLWAALGFPLIFCFLLWVFLRRRS